MENQPKVKADRLPSELFVKKMFDADIEYFSTDPDANGLSEKDDDVIVGRYQLVEYVTVSNKTIVT